MDELLKQIMQELSLGQPFESRSEFFAAIGEVTANHFKISDEVVRVDKNGCDCCARYGYKAGVQTDQEPS